MISIVVPAFNEEDAIADVVGNIEKAMLASRHKQFEIVVVDDGSADRTAEIAETCGDNVRIVRNVKNIGYGFALKQGIRAASFDTIVITDADGTYPIDRIPDLVGIYEQGNELVVGARTGPYYRESLIKLPLRIIFKFLVEFTVGRRVQDVNSGLRVFSRQQILPYFNELSDKFSFTTSQTLIYMLTAKFIHYEPIDYKARIGTSKVKLVRDSLSALQMIVSAILAFNPLKLYLILTLFCILLSLAFLAFGESSGKGFLIQAGGVGIFTSFIIAAIGCLAEVIRRHAPTHPRGGENS